MVKILNGYHYAKTSYGTLSKGAISFGQPCSCSPTTSATTISKRPFVLRCSLHCIMRSVFARAGLVYYGCDVT